MRITNGMMLDTVLANLNRNLNRLEALQTQLTSGKRIQRPSDAPTDVGHALTLRSAVAAGDQYLRNMEESSDWLNASEASLTTSTELLQRVRELAIQGASDTLGSSERGALAAEVNQILEQLVLQGNSTMAGKRLFAGFQTNANPFSLNGSIVTYAGDAGTMLREVDTGSTMQINVDGNAAFTPAFTAVISVRDNLVAGNSAAIGSADLATLDAALSNMLNVRTDVGARINRLDASRSRAALLQERLAGLLSKTEDTDFAATITAFTSQENVYKAALDAGSRALQPSLLDYLK